MAKEGETHTAIKASQEAINKAVELKLQLTEKLLDV